MATTTGSSGATVFDAAVAVTNIAGITAGTYGIRTEADASASATVTINNSGTIQAASGLYAMALAIAATVNVTNSGTISGTAYGIQAQAQADSGTLTVFNTGAITVNATLNGFGIYAAALENTTTTTADVTVNNAAAIAVTGAVGATDGAGVFLEGAGAVTLNNSGTIAATQRQSHGRLRRRKLRPGSPETIRGRSRTPTALRC